MRPVILILVFLVAFNQTSKAQSAQNNAVLEALGGFSAMALYNTYIVIGATADGYASEIYDLETSKTLVQEQIASAQSLIGHCDKLLAPGTLDDPSDKEFITDIRAVLVLLQVEGTALKTYFESGNESDLAIYQEKRKTAWTKLAKLLGIEEK